MADRDVNINIKTEGAGKATENVSAIGKAFKSLTEPILSVRRAVGSLFAALGTVGFIIHGISLIVDAFKSLNSWINRSRTAAAEMAKAQMMEGFSRALDRAAERAKALSERTAETLANLKEIARQGAVERAAAKTLKESQLAYDEQSALAGVTDEEERRRISEEYSLKRADAEKSAAVRDAAAERRSINEQINALKDANAREERYREGREGDRYRMFNAWRNPGKGVDAEEIKKRKEALDKMDAEISASDAKTKANEKLIKALEHQRSLIDSSVEAAENRQRAAYASVSNAQAERIRIREEEKRKAMEAANLDLEEQHALAGANGDNARRRVKEDFQLRRAEAEIRNAKTDEEREVARVKYETVKQSVSNARSDYAREAVREFEELAEKSAAKYDRERAQEGIEERNDRLSKAERALSSDPGALKAADRISKMGGFATAGSAALSGLSAGDKSYAELRAHRDLLKQEIDQLKKIVKNTSDGASFG